MPTNGAIIYRGPSELRRGRLAVVVTGLAKPSHNAKLGWTAAPAWIVPENEHPADWIRSGRDTAACGCCPLKGSAGRGRLCNVRVQAIASVWSAMQAGAYEEMSPSQAAQLLRHRFVRWPFFGEPQSVPLDTWQPFTGRGRLWASYVHDWRGSPDLRQYAMASVHSPQEAQEAQAAGWRTYRIAAPGTLETGPGEAHCPYERNGTTCDRCGLCNGGEGPSIVATAGGRMPQRFADLEV